MASLSSRSPGATQNQKAEEPGKGDRKLGRGKTELALPLGLSRVCH